MDGFKVILKSKWFNAVTIAVVDPAFDPFVLLELPMVTDVKSVLCVDGEVREPDASAPARAFVEQTAYGGGLAPLQQLNADWLHGLGFRGEGMTIAVLDAGFENTESLPIFQRAWNEGRIQEGLDAMYSQGGLFAHHRHGTAVLGTMAGHLEDSLIGTAPDATFVLYRTEDAYSEYLIEEDYWVAAAEHADSIGVDLMNTSFGYSLFDDSTMNHVYDDLNGTTTRISQAAEWAAQKGILCTTSAGNSGAAAWHYITAPADADGILDGRRRGRGWPTRRVQRLGPNGRRSGQARCHGVGRASGLIRLRIPPFAVATAPAFRRPFCAGRQPACGKHFPRQPPKIYGMPSPPPLTCMKPTQ